MHVHDFQYIYDHTGNRTFPYDCSDVVRRLPNDCSVQGTLVYKLYTLFITYEEINVCVEMCIIIYAHSQLEVGMSVTSKSNVNINKRLMGYIHDSIGFMRV